MVFYYDGWKIIETRDGSGNLYQQFIHGTQYIDELVMMRVKDKGDLYVHQDANFNVIALTDLGGSVVQRNTYTPYGQMTVHQGTSFGDRDGDLTVDSTDKGTPGSTCTGTVTGSCRILDLDFDGDYDASDATLFDSLDQGLARHPAKTASGVDFPFGHQGLYYDAELETYDNRYRRYGPATKQFMQRDPLVLLRMHADVEFIHKCGLNQYLCLNANAPNRLDPLGLYPWGPFWNEGICKAWCAGRLAICVAASPSVKGICECNAKYRACILNCTMAENESTGGDVPDPNWNPWEDGPCEDFGPPGGPPPPPPVFPCVAQVLECYSADSCSGKSTGAACGPAGLGGTCNAVLVWGGQACCGCS